MKKHSVEKLMLDLEKTTNYCDYEQIIFRFLDRNDLFYTDIDKIEAQLSILIDSESISIKSIDNLEMYLDNINNRNLPISLLVSSVSTLLSMISLTIQIVDKVIKTDIFSTTPETPTYCFLSLICIFLFLLFYKLQQYKRNYVFYIFSLAITIVFILICLCDIMTSIFNLFILLILIIMLFSHESARYSKRYNKIITIKKAIQQFRMNFKRKKWNRTMVLYAVKYKI